MMDIMTVLLQILFFFDILFAIFIVFFEKKNPAVTWAWLMVVLLLPYCGFIIYMILGFDSRKYKTFSNKARQDEENIARITEKNLEGLGYLSHQINNADIRGFLKIPGAEGLNDLAYLNYVSGNGALTKNNDIRLFHEGNSMFDSLFADIDKAERFIHMEYYIFRSDELGRQVVAALAEKAKQGVEVRLSIDGIGNLLNNKSLFEPLLAAGGHVAVFLPPYFIRINFRNHRKIVVIDGEIGYVGGLNVGMEYLGKKAKFSPWRDTHIRLTGDAVRELELRFITDWNFMSKDKINACDVYFPLCTKTDGSLVQVVSSGPDTKWPSVYNGYSKMISEAEKSIYIQTPYFAPDDNIFESLRIAALSGIDVRVIIPANPDHPFVYWCSMSYLGELLNAGVKCYQYKTGFIHSKLLLIDGLVSSTGTANMDVRSFKLNFEINAFIFDRSITKAFEEKFLLDLADCQEITAEMYEHRSGWQKIKESISRLLSPLL